MTDGANNRGILSPDQAAAIAKQRGIPVFTIGAGRGGLPPFPIFDEKGQKVGYRTLESDLDQDSLSQIATKTGGDYFRASDIDTAAHAFAEIDRTNKIKFQAGRYEQREELSMWFVGAGAGCLFIGAVFIRRMA